MILRGLIKISLALVLLGCATGPKFTPIIEPRGDLALLYVFRPSSPPFALKPTIVINGIKTAELTNKGYFDLKLSPGVYTVKSDWPLLSGVRDSQLTFQADSGRVYYILVAATMHSSGVAMTGTSAIPLFRFESGIGLVDAEAALSSIKECRLVEKYPDAEELVIPK